MVAKMNVEIMLDEMNGDFFEVAKAIDRKYKRGIFTESEMLEMMDILSAKMMFPHN